ncbi:MAG TPA: UvrD-helicase domain-containing protein, partial [Gemmatimonadaceae bacterium]|nr:UvrD-helicase domain-containing protein [Gemmatimonadaceae bacterium]
MAGPGAGKTFCLIRRIGFLIDKLGIKPERICVFTFTNKAAGEIAERLAGELGPSVERVKRGTIHAFCAELLREFGEHVGLQPGFGIADEPDQKAVLRRLKVPPKMQKSVLDAFARWRFRGEPMGHRYQRFYDGYRRMMDERNVADFDTLVLKTAELLRIAAVAADVRARWDAVLVDEFQDLNPIQYAVIRELAREHRHIFVVGDDEQSVYSWTGADPKVFNQFRNDFGIGLAEVVHLRDNRRCPPAVLDPARRLISINESIFENREAQHTTHDSPFRVTALTFGNDERETAWIMDDLRRDHSASDGKLSWGDVALLYRTHKIGSAIETAFLNAGIPCRLAQGRALADDKIVAYVLAALRVIASPYDEIQQELFYQTVLPPPLIDSARAWAEEAGRTLVQQLEHMARTLQREHGDRKKIWRGYFALQNLDALGKSHTSLRSLVEAILSEKVGTYRTVLEEHQEDLSDPASHEEVVGMAERIQKTIDGGQPVWIPRSGGAEIAAKKMLTEMGVLTVSMGGAPAADAQRIRAEDFPLLGFGLGLFKTAQMVRTRSFANTFRDFTAIDLETTDKDVHSAEIVEIAAVRVRNGQIVGEYQTLVKPRVSITSGAAATHGISEEDVTDAPRFEAIWAEFREFCGADVLVAHNGYQFDFPILRRMSATLPCGTDFSTYDTLPLARTLHATSRRLEHLAKRYGIPTGQSHRALDDCRTLAQLFPMLSETRIEYARKTALVNLLDQLGIMLALSDRDSLCDEARKMFEYVPAYSLGRHSDSLDRYNSERELSGDISLPTVDDVIALLGGQQLMDRLRSERTAEKRYPETMGRLRRLIEACSVGGLAEQMTTFLERAVLSRYDGAETNKNRVNLLTMHSTKGLEFSRVYIVGVEDEQLIPTPRNGVLGKLDVEEARRLLYVGMTRTIDRLVMTRANS